MSIERHNITDRTSWLDLRARDVTASAVGALLGCHEYRTSYEIWALKTGRITDDVEDSPALKRGRLLEPVAINLLREMRPDWKIEEPGVYLRDPELRLGATPDAFATDPERGFGVVQVKTVEPSVFRKKWRDPDAGDVQPPLWIALQAICEAHLAGASWAAVAALTVGYGCDLHVVDVPVHQGVIERIREAVQSFWAMVDEGRAPEPDYARDAAVLAAMAPSERAGEVDWTKDNRAPELLDLRRALKAREADGDAARKERVGVDAEILAKLGSHARARLADGRTVTARTIRRSGYSVEAKTFVQLAVREPT